MAPGTGHETDPLEAQTQPVPGADARAPVPGTRHVPGLDGLRAIAVLGVLAVHSGAPGATLGWLGVELFFVLSGFLITTLLLTEADRGRINLARFWTRRFLRLMPAYWLYAIFLTYLILIRRWGWVDTHHGWTPEVFVTSIWLYFVNYLPQGGIWAHQSLSLHLWSLSVEEQFYLIWPLILFVSLKWGWGRRPIAISTWLLIAGFVLQRCLSTDIATGVRSTLESRGFGIFLGCAVALTLADPGSIPIRRLLSGPRFRTGIVLSSIAMYGVTTVASLQFGLTENDVKRYVSPLFCGLFAAIIAMIWYGPNDRFARVLAWQPAVFVGQISYGIYLYHMACHYLVWEIILANIENWNRFAKFGLRLLLFVGLSVGVAAVSYYFVESPFLRLKKRFQSNRVN